MSEQNHTPMSVGEAEAALAPLEAKVRAGREAQQTGHRPVALATPCASCGHPYNWHASRAACEFGNKTNRCGCTRFVPGERPEPVSPWRILGAAAPTAAETGDRGALRDRIAAALLTTRRADYADLGVKANHRQHNFDVRCALCTYDVDSLADAVLAVLSEPTDQAAVPAAALREAADRLDAHMERFFAEWPDEPRNSPYVLGWKDAEAALRRLADEQPTTPTTDPTPLRWGLDDIEHGDDDTTTVLLSGPDGRPYWLELNPERANALREALAETDEQPTTPDCPTPESHNWGCGCPTDQLPLHAQSGIDTPGCDCGHDGMGPKWHARACAWLDTMTVPHPDAVADEPAGPAAPAKEA